MNTIKNNTNDHKFFSPSVNIRRDENANLSYIPTPNSRLVYDQLISDYKIGIRSFNIIGAYGSGKSSFIWALEKSLNGNAELFASSIKIDEVQGFRFINIVGEHYSLINTFAERVGVNTTSEYRVSDIIQKLKNIMKR